MVALCHILVNNVLTLPGKMKDDISVCKLCHLNYFLQILRQVISQISCVTLWHTPTTLERLAKGFKNVSLSERRRHFYAWCSSAFLCLCGQMIDGEAFLLLTQTDIVKIMSIKLGPALKISNAILMFKSTDEGLKWPSPIHQEPSSCAKTILLQGRRKKKKNPEPFFHMFGVQYPSEREKRRGGIKRKNWDKEIFFWVTEECENQRGQIDMEAGWRGGRVLVFTECDGFSNRCFDIWLLVKI